MKKLKSFNSNFKNFVHIFDVFINSHNFTRIQMRTILIKQYCQFAFSKSLLQQHLFFHKITHRDKQSSIETSCPTAAIQNIYQRIWYIQCAHSTGIGISNIPNSKQIKPNRYTTRAIIQHRELVKVSRSASSLMQIRTYSIYV